MAKAASKRVSGKAPAHRESAGIGEAGIGEAGTGPLLLDLPGNEAEEAGKPHYLGHRQRLRDRFLSHNGPASLADYELLELLLFPAKPRQDVKPLAKALLARFDGFAGVLAADQVQLLAFPGLGEASVVALKLAQASAERLLRQEVHNRPVLSTWQKLIDYCTVAMSRSLVEEFRLLFLDRKNVLIADELHQTGTVDHTPAYPREVVKRALELGASALILVHNHPSGDPTPSKADIEITREIAKACAALGLQLHDHVIIGRGKHASFKSMGLI